MNINFGNADISLVNTVRRIILRDVYTYAIEKVIINENTSVIHDEMLSDRLALVPLRVTYKSAYPPVSIPLSMSVTCEEGIRNIYARDIVYKADTNVDINVPYPDILIAVLAEGQTINIEAECIRGNGEKHYKFSPTTTTDVIKEGDSIKLCAELIGQLTKEEILGQVNIKLKEMVQDITNTIDRSMDT